MKMVLWVLFLAWGMLGCKKNGGAGVTPPPVVVDTPIVRGADISWLTQMEASGYKFYNSSGAALDCIQLLQSLGINAIRLRVWVNPADGWNNNADVVQKAKRVKQLGLRLMLD